VIEPSGSPRIRDQASSMIWRVWLLTGILEG
jgi:hypothetical protein